MRFHKANKQEKFAFESVCIITQIMHECVDIADGAQQKIRKVH